jgi:phosphoglycolate phosphatase
MIGDREHDMIGARRNGVRAIGVTYGYGSAAELRAHGPEALADAPHAIPALVAALLGRT